MDLPVPCVEIGRPPDRRKFYSAVFVYKEALVKKIKERRSFAPKIKATYS
jgi:hypothetical protein